MAVQETKKNHNPGSGVKAVFDGLLSAVSNIVNSSNNVIGVDIGSSYVKILQLQKNGSRYGVRHCLTRALPPSAQEAPAEKKKLVQEFIRGFLTESRVKTKLARIVVSGKGVFIFSLTVPQMNKKDLKGAVGIELKKRLPAQMDIAAIAYDFLVNGPVDEKNPTLQITCIAADKAAIEEQVQLLKDMKLTPVAVFAIPDSLGSLVPFCLDNQAKGTVVLLDIGASVTQLNFYKAKQLVFSRDIPIGGEHFTAILSKNLTYPEGQIVVSMEDAEKLKRNWGIPLDEEAKADFLTDFGQFSGEQITTIMRPVLERLVMEISRTISYYVKTFRSDKIGELYLTGGGSRLHNIDKFLLYNLEGIEKVQPLDILKAVKGWSERFHSQEMIMEQAAPHLAVAFGLCLGGGGRVNLLPMKERLEQKANLLSTLLKFAVPLVVAVNLLFYALVYVNGLKFQMLVKQLTADMQRLEPTAQKVKEYQAGHGRIEQARALLEKAKGKQPSWMGLMKELSALVPPEITITRISTDDENIPRRIRLIGTLYPPQYAVVDLALSQFLVTLEESPYFKQVELTASRKDAYGQAHSLDFEIVCTLNY